MKPLEGYQVERQGLHAVALDVELDEPLRTEGRARDITRAIQIARQDAGLEITDRILLTLDGDPVLLDAARAHQEYIAARDARHHGGLRRPRRRGRAGARRRPAAEDRRQPLVIDRVSATIVVNVR